MPLENLLTLVEKLRECIDSHGNALRQNEWLTRYALIDPLLRELGWDTEDPDIVRPEYVLDQNRKRPDYVLRNNGVPVMILEAKKLGESLANARMQAANYAMADASVKARYFSTTNGSEWEIYDTNRPANNMMTASFDLNNNSVADACLKALALWRPSVISGQIAVGETPVIGLPDDQPGTTEHRPTEETTVQPTSLDLDEEGWVSLSELKKKKGDPSPTGITFPDGSRASPKHWTEMVTEVMRWLMENGHLSERQCPIPRGPRSERPLVDTIPMHSSGGKSSIKSIDSLYIDTHGDSDDMVKYVRILIQHVGQDLAQFQVRFP